MPKIPIFYCCPCQKCGHPDKIDEDHRIFLPYETEGLGEYTKLRARAGHYEYGEPYLKARSPLAPELKSPLPPKPQLPHELSKDAWPARFACFHCAILDSCAKEDMIKLEKERLRKLNGESLWRIEIEDEDPHYRTSPSVNETLYTRARTGLSKEKLISFVRNLPGYATVNSERVHVRSFPYNFSPEEG